MKLINLISLIFILFLSPLKELISQNNKWESIGPQGVRYNSVIKFDPFSERFYLIGGSTLFKKEKNTGKWINISPDNKNIYDLVIKDSGPDEIYSLNERVIYKSTDAGNKWEVFFSDSIHYPVFMDNRDPDILIASKPSGGWGNFFSTIQRSTDAGKNWFDITNGINLAVGPVSAFVNPYFPNMIFVSQMISYGGDVVWGNYYYNSTNNGSNWIKLNLDSLTNIQKCFFDPLDINTFYLKRYSKPFIKTTDGGNSWFEIGSNLMESNLSGFLISPYNPGVLYTSIEHSLPDENSEIYKSENGGLTWSKYASINPSQNISSVLIDPDNHGELYIVSYPYGIFQSINHGTGWTDKSDGLNISGVCSFSVGNSKIIYAGIENKGFFRTTDGGETWTNIYKDLSSCPGYILVSSNNPLLIFTDAYMNGINFSRSEDGGNTWQSFPCNYNGLFVFDVATDDQTIYGDAFTGINGTLTISSIIKSSDGGQNWELLDLDMDDINYIAQIIIDPSDKEMVYSIIAIRGSISTNSLVKTTDGGQNWKIIADTALYAFINDRNPDYVYYTGKSNLFISGNKGETFQKVPANYDFRQIVADNSNGSTLYALTYNGIIKSEDYGYTWKTIDELRDVSGINDFGISYSDSGYPIFFGSTYHNGILKYELKQQAAGSIIQPTESEYSLFQNYPNPFNPVTAITYQLPKGSNVRLIIYNILGEKIDELVNSFQKAGKYKIDWNAEGYTSGIYFCTLWAMPSDGRGENFCDSKKFILLK